MIVLQSLSLNYFELETRTDDITWQNMPEGDTPSTPIPARRVFSFNCNPSPHQRPTQFSAPLQFMHPDTMEVIRAGLNGTESILVTLSLSSSSFHNLRILDLQVRFVSCPQFIPALHQCPCLNTLRLRSAFTDSPAGLSMAPLPSRILPALTTYHGPPSLASIFAHGRQIRSFKLWSSRRVSSVSKPEKVAPLLSHLGPYVETLEIGVTTLPAFLMRVIADALPKLRSLSVNGHLSSDHTGVATMHISETPFHPCIGIIESVALLHLDFLCLGVQIPDTVTEGSPEHENIVWNLFNKFPTEYNPTSWDQWAIDLAWSRLIWNRLDIADRQGGSPGKLSVEHVEYRNPVFRSLE
ncbi:hypothetical protein FPV67DRAFT_175765 [Lyophyllum atratum]|nr:hypothetical protein FPV67DRAFT_175765 [Lyophyllum atratum]